MQFSLFRFDLFRPSLEIWENPFFFASFCFEIGCFYRARDSTLGSANQDQNILQNAQFALTKSYWKNLSHFCFISSFSLLLCMSTSESGRASVHLLMSCRNCRASARALHFTEELQSKTTRWWKKTLTNNFVTNKPLTSCFPRFSLEQKKLKIKLNLGKTKINWNMKGNCHQTLSIFSPQQLIIFTVNKDTDPCSNISWVYASPRLLIGPEKETIGQSQREIGWKIHRT